MAVNSKDFKDNGTQFYPVTHIEAVIDGNGTNLDSLLSGKQATLVSGTNIKTVNNNSLLGSGNITISGAGTLNTNNTTAQSVNSSEALSGTVKLHKVAKTGTYSDLIGTPTIPTVNNSTITFQMNGSTVDSFTTNAASGKTIDLGGNYSKTVYLNDESSMPASPDSNTLYLIAASGSVVNIVYLTSESQMPASPDSNTLYLILESE